MATILIDHPSRELSVAKALGYILSKKFDVLIDDQDGYFASSDRSPWSRLGGDRDFIITPSYNTIRTRNVRLRALVSRVPIILYHSEQVLIPAALNEKLDYRQPAFIEDIALHLAWGPAFAYALLARGVPRDRIFIVGNNRLPPSTPSPAFNGTRLKGKQRVLLLSSFSGADWSNEEWENISKEYGYDLSLKSNVTFRAGRQRFCSLANDLAEKGFNISVRTHPGEKPDYYLATCNQRVRVSDGNQTPFDSDLRGVDLVIVSNHSTAIYDLLARNVAFISVDFGCGSHAYPKFAYPQIMDSELLTAADFDGLQTKSRDAALTAFNWFFHVGSTASNERIANLLLNHQPGGLRLARWRLRDCLSLFEFTIKTLFWLVSFYFGWKWFRNRIEMSGSRWVAAGHGITASGEGNADLNIKRGSFDGRVGLTACKLDRCEYSEVSRIW